MLQSFKLLLRALRRRSSGKPVRQKLVSCLFSLLQPDTLHTSGWYISWDGTYAWTVHTPGQYTRLDCTYAWTVHMLDGTCFQCILPLCNVIAQISVMCTRLTSERGDMQNCLLMHEKGYGKGANMSKLQSQYRKKPWSVMDVCKT